MATRSDTVKSSVKSSRRRRPRTNDEENKTPNSLADDNTAWTQDGADDKDFQILSKKIRKAEETLKVDIWKSNDALRQAVIRASLRLGEEGDDVCNNLLLFNEHESRLVKHCRLFVKEATEEEDQDLQYARLFLATQLIRALTRFVTKSSTQEALLQLLYHIMNTLDNKNINAQESVIFHAFEALHHILLRFRKDISGMRISFATAAKEKVFVFPIPIFKTVIETMYEAVLSVDKIFAIAIQTITIVGKSIFTRPRIEGTVVPAFLCRLEKQPTYIAQHLLATVAVEWIHLLVKVTKNVKDGLSHCKRVHRILWEKAADTNLTPLDSLALRQSSISVLLSGESKTLCKALESKFAETACLYAWKASATFLASSNSLEDLVTLHEVVGVRFDSIFADNPGLAYLEYCSHRAQHVGIFPPNLLSSSKRAYHQTFSILQLAMLATDSIRSLTGRKKDLKIPLDSAKEILSSFRCACLDSDTEWQWSSEDFSWILKIIQVNQLHKELFTLTRTEGNQNIGDWSTLGGQIMTRCLGPLLLRAAKNIKNERAKLCEKGVDCLIRGISVFELEKSRKVDTDESVVAAKDFIQLSSRYRLINDETASCFEKFAKVSL